MKWQLLNNNSQTDEKGTVVPRLGWCSPSCQWSTYKQRSIAFVTSDGFMVAGSFSFFALNGWSTTVFPDSRDGTILLRTSLSRQWQENMAVLKLFPWSCPYFQTCKVVFLFLLVLIKKWRYKKIVFVVLFWLLDNGSLKELPRLSGCNNTILLKTFKGSPFWSCVNINKFINFMKRQFLVLHISQVQLKNTIKVNIMPRKITHSEN